MEAVVARWHTLIVVGTRPELIKLAPVIDECRRRETLRVTVCFTGQHVELVAPVAEYFGVVPDVCDCMESVDSLATCAARMLAAMDAQLAQFKPDCVVAQGDTTSVLCAALAAFYRRVPLVHVEAGLRTHNLAAPWPEEMNRRVATLAATLHCAPTPKAVQNLLAEGVPSTDIDLTGNTVIDALLATVRRERDRSRYWAAKHAMLGSRRMVLITGHRRENHGDGLRSVCAAIQRLALFYRDVVFLYVLHPNPQVCGPVTEYLAGRENIYLLRPVRYPEFVWLMDRSTLIITDSGGVQEEAPSLAKPVLVTRESTERPESVACGIAKLVGTDVDTILNEVSKLLDGNGKLAEAVKNPYGDGKAAGRVVDAISRRFSLD